MILGHISSCACYEAVHPGLRAAFSFLRREDLLTTAPGRYGIDREGCYAVIGDEAAVEAKRPLLESHRRFIDVFYFPAGEAKMAWCPSEFCSSREGIYMPERDVEFFRDEPQNIFPLKEGLFAIYHSGEAHWAVVTSPKARKIVIKVEL